MKLVGNIIAALAATTAVSLPAFAFSPSPSETQTRGDFLSTAALAVASAVVVNPIQPSYARGRATLEAAYDRYVPRINEGGVFYKKELYGKYIFVFTYNVNFKSPYTEIL